MNTRSVAVRGIGYGTLAIATRGFLTEAVVVPDRPGSKRSVSVFEVSRAVDAGRLLRIAMALSVTRETLAANAHRNVEVKENQRDAEAETEERDASVGDVSREVSVDV